MAATAVGGITIFWLNLRKIRELNLKIKQLEMEVREKEEVIYRPTTQEAALYGMKPAITAEIFRIEKLRNTSYLKLILILILTPPFLYIIYHAYLPHPAPPILGGELQITIPRTGDTVSSTVLIKGYTPFNDKRVYLLVRSEYTGVHWVEPPVVIDSKGNWIGRVFLPKKSFGETFAIRAIATDKQLETGPLVGLPEDAILSSEIRVRLAQ
jgi:hypothetical protein